MLILLDQDGVLADFERGVYEGWHQQYGGEAPIAAQRQHFYIRDDTPPEYHEQLQALYTRAGFFEHLPPKAGAIEAAHALVAAGHDVRICTAPINQYRNCVAEKIAWAEHHLGAEWLHRIIITKDKTWVRGDILIDDKPIISGSLTPTWQHWLYDAPYNRYLTHAKRVEWTQPATWHSLLSPTP